MIEHDGDGHRHRGKEVDETGVRCHGVDLFGLLCLSAQDCSLRDERLMAPVHPQFVPCGSRTIEPALTVWSSHGLKDIETRGRLRGNKKARYVQAASLFSLCSLNECDELRILTNRAVFSWKSKQYHFVFPKVLVDRAVVRVPVGGGVYHDDRWIA